MLQKCLLGLFESIDLFGKKIIMALSFLIHIQFTLVFYFLHSIHSKMNNSFIGLPFFYVTIANLSHKLHESALNMCSVIWPSSKAAHL